MNLLLIIERILGKCDQNTKKAVQWRTPNVIQIGEFYFMLKRVKVWQLKVLLFVSGNQMNLRTQKLQNCQEWYLTMPIQRCCTDTDTDFSPGLLPFNITPFYYEATGVPQIR